MPRKAEKISAARFVRFLFQQTLTSDHWQRTSQKKGASNCSRFVHEHFRLQKKPLTAVSALFVKAPYKACRTVWRFRGGKKARKSFWKSSKLSHSSQGRESIPMCLVNIYIDYFWKICQIVSGGYSSTSLGNTFQNFTSLIFRKAFFVQLKFSLPLFWWRKITYVCHNPSATKYLLTLACCHGATQKQCQMTDSGCFFFSPNNQNKIIGIKILISFLCSSSK